jgi:hypothetical protein
MGFGERNRRLLFIRSYWLDYDDGGDHLLWLQDALQEKVEG